ncbi:MAG: hypothetical protein E7603_08735 [Ruminococcaceae bacterium]|nr:hypothetical protein [Oscillospiraceae bacterium]
MNKKLFVVSDIHGHDTELKKALDDAGFEAENKNHVFVSCGDLFDRGGENDKVYAFIKSLKQKILIKGNHEDILYEVLSGGKMTVEAELNGTDMTITQIFGKDAFDENGNFNKELYQEKADEMLAFIDSMLNDYETETYVFTHGWLPIVFEGNYPKIDPFWRDASEQDWKESRWLEWQQLYSAKATLEEKTIVCGHRPARLGHMFDDWREPDSNEPFYGDGVIAIDANTVRSGFVNVLVVEQK